jgi:hypothetical protein
MAKKRSKKWKEPDAECKTCDNEAWCNHDKETTPCEAFKDKKPAAVVTANACPKCGINAWDYEGAGKWTCRSCGFADYRQCLDLMTMPGEPVVFLCRQDAKPCAVPCRFAAKNAAEMHAKKKQPVACDQSDPRAGDVLICKITGTSCNGSKLAGKCIKKRKDNMAYLEKAHVSSIQSKRKAGKPGKTSQFARLF